MRIVVSVDLIFICRLLQKHAVCLRAKDFNIHLNLLARAVGSPCVHSDECGPPGECSNKICVCKSNYKITDSNDHFGRKIQICINGKTI